MSNPLLGTKLPGRVFQLPSKGLFYKPGILADTVQNGEIQVKAMSAMAELRMKSADLLVSGKVLREVCAMCCPEIIAPEKLISKDIDAFFVFLVLATYGKEKTVSVGHHCKGKKEHEVENHEYMIDLEHIIGNPNNEALNHYSMLYTLPLTTGQRVILRPVNFSDSMNLVTVRQDLISKHRNGETVTSEEMENLLLLELHSVIEAVEVVVDGGKTLRIDDSSSNDGVNGRTLIDQWLRSVSKKTHDEIVAGALKTTEWGFNYNSKLACKECGEVFTYELDLNPINFFYG